MGNDGNVKVALSLTMSSTIRICAFRPQTDSSRAFEKHGVNRRFARSQAIMTIFEEEGRSRKPGGTSRFALSDVLLGSHASDVRLRLSSCRAGLCKQSATAVFGRLAYIREKRLRNGWTQRAI